MPKDPQLEDLHAKYDQVCDRLDGYWDAFHALDEDDEFNSNNCVYDIDEDPCRDSCLFCCDPEERK